LLGNIGHGQLDNTIDTTRRDEIGQMLAGLSTTQTQLRERAAIDRQHREDERVRGETDRRALEEIKGVVAAVRTDIWTSGSRRPARTASRWSSPKA
jgi:methyl-accepting chemotaxis protein